MDDLNKVPPLSNNQQEGLFHSSNEGQPVKETTKQVEEHEVVTQDKEGGRKDRYYSSTIAPSRRLANSYQAMDTVGANRISQLVWYLGSVLAMVLSLRFILQLLGAANTSFAGFIYQMTDPFVTPFRSLFGTSALTYRTGHFEVETLVAIVVVGIVTFILVGFIRTFGTLSANEL